MEFRNSRAKTNRVAIAVIVCLLLQAGLSTQVNIVGGTFDFMFALTCYMAAQGDPSKAVVAGFFSGLYFDLTGSTPVGLMALVLTITAFVLVHSTGFTSSNGSSSQIPATFAYCAAVHAVYGVVLFAMGVQTNIFIAIFGHALSTAVLSTIVTVILMRVLAPASRSMGFSAKSGGTRFKSKPKSLK